MFHFDIFGGEGGWGVGKGRGTQEKGIDVSTMQKGVIV